MSRIIRFAAMAALVALAIGVVTNAGAAVTTVTKASKGPRGPRGPRGFRGPPGITTIHDVSGPKSTMGTTCNSSTDCSQVQSAIATCPTGEVATGGGYESSSINLNVGF